MPQSHHPEIVFEHDDFEFANLEEELLVDQRCQQVLRHFYLYLQQQGLPAERASELAFAADLYVRDYLLDFACQNLVRPQPGIVRKFAASWFITHTLDPEMEILERHLTAIAELYRFLHRLHLVSADELAYLLEETGQTDFYKGRIENFLNISGDGFVAWDAICPAKP
ncbi:MAG: hypothetical protein HY888_09040 [Deltaproteobacteria bacterium]|nr:hypothetical protein [Deltaproteobacteria bacterium]